MDEQGTHGLSSSKESSEMSKLSVMPVFSPIEPTNCVDMDYNVGCRLRESPPGHGT